MRFWDWAVAAYARQPVAAACLNLQDGHGQNVPWLLWAAWMAGGACTAPGRQQCTHSCGAMPPWMR